MANESVQYDVFISYSRNDQGWVYENLYKPLMLCRTAEGHPPHIFYDVGSEGIGVGDNFPSVLANAISNCRKFIPVYSLSYISKPFCVWELEKAWARDPSGRSGILCPILIDPKAEDNIPSVASLINYWKTSAPDWFERLCSALDLHQVKEVLKLVFVNQPPDRVVVNNTLSSIRVALSADGHPYTREALIMLSAPDSLLQGKSNQTITNGVAVFDDLSFGKSVDATCLVAMAEGCEPVKSRLFSVNPPYVAPPRELGPAIPLAKNMAGSLPVFYTSGSIALVSANRMVAYDPTGKTPLSPKCELDLSGQIRLVRRDKNRIAAATWNGNVGVIWEDGHTDFWNLGDDSAGFSVIGDLAFEGEILYAGLWNGLVYRLASFEKPQPVLRNRMGVQAIACAGGRLFICGFNGGLEVYEQGRHVNSDWLEPTLRLLQSHEEVLIAAGERKLYHIRVRPLEVVSEAPPLNNILAVAGDVARPVAIDVDGKGICFDEELTIRSIFHTAAGAVPISADRSGHWCTFRNPDGSFSLMRKNKIVYSTHGGVLAVAPDGQLFAVGEKTWIHLMTEEQIQTLFKEEGQ